MLLGNGVQGGQRAGWGVGGVGGLGTADVAAERAGRAGSSSPAQREEEVGSI